MVRLQEKTLLSWLTDRRVGGQGSFLFFWGETIDFIFIPWVLLVLGKHSLPTETHPQQDLILIWRQGLTGLPGLELAL